MWNYLVLALSCNKFLTLKRRGTARATIAISVKQYRKETFSKILQITFSVPVLSTPY